jgi:hypothetical protein
MSPEFLRHGICAQRSAFIARALDGWRGIHSKADFEAVQFSADPIAVSMRR